MNKKKKRWERKLRRGEVCDSPEREKHAVLLGEVDALTRLDVVESELTLGPDHNKQAGDLAGDIGEDGSDVSMALQPQ